MALVTENRRRVVALAVGSRIRIGRARVGVVTTRLAFPVGLRVAPATTGPLIIAAILRSKALLAGPRLDQRAVDGEVFLGQQATVIRQAHDLGEEAFHHLMCQQRSRFFENVE